jgi:hypothetical protein
MQTHVQFHSPRFRRLTTVKVVLLVGCMAAPASPQSLGKRTATEALRTIRTFADWYEYDGGTSDLLDGPVRKPLINPRINRPPWNFCSPPDKVGPNDYSAIYLDNSESTATLDERGQHVVAERLSNRILQYLGKHGYKLQAQDGYTWPHWSAAGCYEHNGAVVRVIQACNGCSNFTKYPYDGVFVTVISPVD